MELSYQILFFSFIAAVDYFQEKFPASTILFDISVTYIVTTLITVLINNILVETISWNKRIYFGKLSTHLRFKSTYDE